MTSENHGRVARAKSSAKMKSSSMATSSPIAAAVARSDWRRARVNYGVTTCAAGVKAARRRRHREKWRRLSAMHSAELKSVLSRHNDGSRAAAAPAASSWPSRRRRRRGRPNAAGHREPVCDAASAARNRAPSSAVGFAPTRSGAMPASSGGAWSAGCVRRPQARAAS